MKVIIGCSRNRDNKIGSELIQWWDNTDYSHIYVRWWLTTQEREVVYHAAHGMVHFLSLDNFQKNNVIVKEFVLELTDEQFKRFSAKCIDLAGQKYSHIELIQIVISDISNGKIKFEDQPGFICSELVGSLLKELGYGFDKPTFLLKPIDIINALELGK